MLWRGIAKYAVSCGARYLIGCSSLSSQDENEALALYEALREKHMVEPGLRTHPKPSHVCRESGEATANAQALPRISGNFWAALRTASD
jgi:putative hemolysin